MSVSVSEGSVVEESIATSTTSWTCQQTPQLPSPSEAALNGHDQTETQDDDPLLPTQTQASVLDTDKSDSSPNENPENPLENEPVKSISASEVNTCNYARFITSIFIIE